MACKFGEGPPGAWEFRPSGEADPATTAELRARAAEAFPRRKGLWSRLFGG